MWLALRTVIAGEWPFQESGPSSQYTLRNTTLGPTAELPPPKIHTEMTVLFVLLMTIDRKYLPYKARMVAITVYCIAFMIRQHLDVSV
jgi:hypothetical protein